MKTSCLFICLFFIVMTAGCFRAQAPFGASQSDLRDDRNYTFAIYNDQNRLMNYPLKDLTARVNALERENLLKDLCKDLDSPPKQDLIARCNRMTQSIGSNKITDIYVVSHGWNYTIDESITNYQKYIDLINAKVPPSKNFHPYFIFISWPSAARPLTNLARAIFPFGVDNDLSQYTSAIDHTLLFFPTVWKQSLNAYENALGNRSTSEYHKSASFRKNWKNQEGVFGDNGRDVPVALILYELLKLNKTDSENVDEPRDSVKIHLVGHSFGAKLLSHAVLQALEWWIEDTFSLNFSVSTREGNSKNKDNDSTVFDWDKFFKWWKTEKPNKFHEKLPVESLLLFNPAMNFSELSSPLLSSPFSSMKGFDQTSLLQFIARKGIVYSNSDYPNGAFFDIAQIPFNTSLNQEYHTLLGGIGKRVDSMDWFENEKPKVIGTFKNDSHGNLAVKFNEQATSAAVIALLQNITYKNTNSDNPSYGIRTIRHVLVDNMGAIVHDHTTTVGVSNPSDKESELNIDLIYENFGEAQTINEWVNLNEGDIDEGMLDSGTLTVALEGGHVIGDDILDIRHQGIGYKQIGLNGKNITYVGRQYLNVKKFFLWPVAKPFQLAYTGIVPAVSALNWASTKPYNIISNFNYHLKHNTTFAPTEGPWEFLRQGFNGLHFFLPLDKFFEAFHKDGGVPEDQWGIWRSNIPALGRTGLANADKGVFFVPGLIPQIPYFPIFEEETLRDYVGNSEERLESQISEEELCDLSVELGIITVQRVINPKLIYSIDASKILNDKWLPVGAHDDIRSNEGVECPKKAKLSKREFMLNFIYNFTNGGDIEKVKRLTKE